jgi:hypothetical protein
MEREAKEAGRGKGQEIKFEDGHQAQLEHPGGGALRATFSR